MNINHSNYPRLPPPFQTLFLEAVSPEDFIQPSPHIVSYGHLAYSELARISQSPLHVSNEFIPHEEHSCISPVILPNGHSPRLGHCGKCLLCRKRNTAVWSNRFSIESSLSHRTYFVTLTYNDAHVSVLNSSDYQKYFKRLRYYGLDFSYSIIGEYGPTGGRPHFHCLLFVKTQDEDSAINNLIRGAWPFGFVDIKTPTNNHLYYIAGYVKDLFTAHETFRRFSQKPAIGRRPVDTTPVLDYIKYTDESAPAATGTLFSPYTTSASLHKHGYIDDTQLEERQRTFYEDVPDKDTLQNTLSTDYLRSYLKDFSSSYSHFLNLKL